MKKQILVSKRGSKSVGILICVYLGPEPNRPNLPQVAFLDGSGVCNSLALDMFRSVKKLK